MKWPSGHVNGRREIRYLLRAVCRVLDARHLRYCYCIVPSLSCFLTSYLISMSPCPQVLGHMDRSNPHKQKSLLSVSGPLSAMQEDADNGSGGGAPVKPFQTRGWTARKAVEQAQAALLSIDEQRCLPPCLPVCLLFHLEPTPSVNQSRAITLTTWCFPFPGGSRVGRTSPTIRRTSSGLKCRRRSGSSSSVSASADPQWK